MPFSNIYQKLGYLFSPQNRVEVQIKMANNFSGSFNGMSGLYTASSRFPLRYSYLISLQPVP